jgi:Kdo2-lipid IVA lauroyltransferase/acyltransferase
LHSYLIYVAARIILFLLRKTPRRAGIWVLSFLADLVYWFDIKHRHIARVNLRIAFPHLSARQRDRIARRSFRNTALNLLEVSKLTSLNKYNISSLVEYDAENGLNNFNAALATGKPILYLTGHFSSWELLPAAHALHGYPLSFVTRPLDNARLEQYLRTLREASGNSVISKKDSARTILRVLDASGCVGLLLDQNTIPQEGVFVEFFGLPASTSSGAALLALRKDATVLPGYLSPPQRGRYKIKFLPPLSLTRTGDTVNDVQVNTLLFNRVLESIVREQPESWLWGHKRWSFQEEGAPGDLYRLPEDKLEVYLQENMRDHASVAPCAGL